MNSLPRSIKPARFLTKTRKNTSIRLSAALESPKILQKSGKSDLFPCTLRKMPYFMGCSGMDAAFLTGNGPPDRHPSNLPAM
jgi:hypothetical protein